MAQGRRPIDSVFKVGRSHAQTVTFNLADAGFRGYLRPNEQLDR
jgi:hypothetical protein